MFLNDSAQIQRALFHNKSQQLHPNNDSDILVEAEKAPLTIAIKLLLLLLLVPLLTVLPYYVGGYCYCCIIDIDIATTSFKKNRLITERILQKIHENVHSN